MGSAPTYTTQDSCIMLQEEAALQGLTATLYNAPFRCCRGEYADNGTLWRQSRILSLRCIGRSVVCCGKRWLTGITCSREATLHGTAIDCSSQEGECGCAHPARYGFCVIRSHLCCRLLGIIQHLVKFQVLGLAQTDAIIHATSHVGVCRAMHNSTCHIFILSIADVLPAARYARKVLTCVTMLSNHCWLV